MLHALAKAGVRRAVFNTGGVRLTEPVGVPFVDARALLSAELANVVEVATEISPARTYLENLAAPWSAARVRAGEVAGALGHDVRWNAIDPGEYERMLLPYLGAEVAAGIAAAYVPPGPPAPDPDLVVHANITLRGWASRVDWSPT